MREADHSKTDRARHLRLNSTKAELKLWNCLRSRALGQKFVRQVPIGPYVVDFACRELRLVIEVDGGQHAEVAQADHDKRRTDWLRTENFRVLRFWNPDIFENMDGVLDMIDAAIREAPLPLSPSRKGRG